jgi:hypothetical protein
MRGHPPWRKGGVQVGQLRRTILVLFAANFSIPLPARSGGRRGGRGVSGDPVREPAQPRPRRGWPVAWSVPPPAAFLAALKHTSVWRTNGSSLRRLSFHNSLRLRNLRRWLCSRFKFLYHLPLRHIWHFKLVPCVGLTEARSRRGAALRLPPARAKYRRAPAPGHDRHVGC